jgi:Eco57I restriction-modification methylase
MKMKKKMMNKPKLKIYSSVIDDTLSFITTQLKNSKSFKIYIQKKENIDFEEAFDLYIRRLEQFLLLFTSLWSLQRRGFFKGDPNYLISAYNQLAVFKENQEKKEMQDTKAPKEFSTNYNYSIFLSVLFCKLFNIDKPFFSNLSTCSSKLYEICTLICNDIIPLGRDFISDNFNDEWDVFAHEIINDELFFSKEVNTNNVKNLPILNMFHYLEENKDPMDNFTVGALFEKFLTTQTKKKTGAYYTPKIICDYISNIALSSYLENTINQKLRNISSNSEKNEKLNLKTGTTQLFPIGKKIEKIFLQTENNEKKIICEQIFQKLKAIKILDPCVGSGHFLASIVDCISEIVRVLWNFTRNHNIKKILNLESLGVDSNFIQIDLSTIEDFKEVEIQLKMFMIRNNLFGIDINFQAVIFTKLRLLLNLFQNYTPKSTQLMNLFFSGKKSRTIFNIITGNTLLGKGDKRKKSNLLSYTKFSENNNKLKGNKALNPKESKNWTRFFPKIFKSGERDFEKFDLIVGNPPYGNLLSKEDKEGIQHYASFSKEISAAFIERCIQLNKSAGNLVFITSYAITFSKDLSQTRDKIAQNYHLCKIATFDRDKCRFFEGMTQSVSILELKDKKPKNINTKSAERKPFELYTTNMFRKMPDLYRLQYQNASEFLLSGRIGATFRDKHRIPKIGFEKNVVFLQHLRKLSLIDWKNNNISAVSTIISSPSIIRSQNDYNKFKSDHNIDEAEELCVRISGNYWYNAWNKPPYFGTQIAMIKIPEFWRDKKEEIRNFLLILINSSTFYVWFRIYSDGRHMNSDILKAIPLPDNCFSKLECLKPYLKLLSDFLMKIQFKHFDSKNNRFNSSEIKPIIDCCDIFLKILYNFSTEILEFILNYEETIRKGKQIDDFIHSEINDLLEITMKQEITSSNLAKLKKILEKIENVID